MSKVLAVECPHCQEELNVEVPQELLGVPFVRSRIKPIGNIAVYRITSNEIKEFVTKKARFYRPEIQLEVSTHYCERKKSNPHRSYAYLKIGFNSAGLEQKEDAGWFERVGEGGASPRILSDIFVGLVQKYKYNKEGLDDLLDNYKKMENLENAFGLTEGILKDIRMYATPRRTKAINGDSWVIFSARAEKVIEDMLENPDNDKVAGRIEIQDIYAISKDQVEFVVYVHPLEMRAQENPYVRKIMMGEAKVD